MRRISAGPWYPKLSTPEVALALNYLVEWIAHDKTPPRAPYIAVDQDPANDGSHLLLDQFGNGKGGIRNIWVDVPVATHGVFGKGRTPDADFLCRLAGTELRLPDSVLKKLYANKEDYVAQANRRLDELIAEVWFLPEYADSVRGEILATEIPSR
jgi:hypothetical protein